MSGKRIGGSVAIGIGLLLDVANWYPTTKATIDALKNAGGVPGVISRVLLDPVFGLVVIAVGLVALFGFQKTAGDIGQTTTGGPVGQLQSQGSAAVSGYGSSANVNKSEGGKVELHQHYYGAPAAEPTSSNALRSEVDSAQQRLDQFKAKTVPATISVRADGGKEAVVTARSTGRAADVVMVMSIRDASSPIDHRQPYRYIVRTYASGGLPQTYMVASLSDWDREIIVWAENLHLVQKFRTKIPNAFVELHLSFYSEDEKHRDHLATKLTRLVSDGD